MNKWETFKTKVSEHSEEIVGGVIITATVIGYAFLVRAAVKQVKLDNQVKKAQVTLYNQLIDQTKS